jgi:hypothetical protein
MSQCLFQKGTKSVFNSSFDDFSKVSKKDTIKPPEEYMGYRLHLSNIQVLKKTDNWMRIQFSVINTGRSDVNFAKDGTEHWVQFFFDNSLYESKLGGWKDQIRYAFYKSNFKLKAGKIAKDAELKVDTNTPIISSDAVLSSEEKKEDEGTTKIVFAAGSDKEITEKDIRQSKIQCPDLVIEKIEVKKQSKKWATLEYTLKNIGKGPVDLIERVGPDPIKLAIRAHISGVATLSKGALSIGGAFVGEDISEKDITLYPDGEYKSIIKLDIRNKTRYMKTIILSLDTHEIPYECDRTNNTNAIELE